MSPSCRKPLFPLLSVLVLIVLLCTGSGGTFGETAPRFSWGAFQRIWNTRALPGAEIRDAQAVEEGRLVSYAPSSNLVVLMKDNMVYGVRAEFADVPEQENGGRLFLKAVDSALKVGTYRWPEDRYKEVTEKFRIMTPDPVIYQWRTSRFFRVRQADNLWVFRLEFVEEGSPIPQPADM